ncbi:MAG: TIGR03915 family putative DNA repair protein [Chitinophagales bacterium]
MKVLVYDGSFEGLLSAVFYVYEHKLADVKIARRHTAVPLFGEVVDVATCDEKAARLWKGLKQHLGNEGQQCIYSNYLADSLREEDNILRYIQYAFAAKHNIVADYSNVAVLQARKVERMVSRERHRMTAFVRFMLTKDGLYYAQVEPDFNVLPLIARHFEKRYADQRWLIYDCKRSYGIYYDLQQVEMVQLNMGDEAQNNLSVVLDEKEEAYQQLWQQYFNSVNIKERKNKKLHLQHMPKRYWKYLPEKQK